MKKFSIGLRLTLWYLAIFAIAQAIFGAGMWFILRTHMYDLVDDNLEGQVADLKHYLQAQRRDLPLAKLKEEVTEEYDLERPSNYLQIYLGNGEWVYRSAFLQEHPLVPLEPGSIKRASMENHRFGKKTLRFITQKIDVDGIVVVAQTGEVINDVVETLALFRTYLLMFAPLVLLIAIAVWDCRDNSGKLRLLLRHAFGFVLSALLPVAISFAGSRLRRAAAFSTSDTKSTGLAKTM